MFGRVGKAPAKGEQSRGGGSRGGGDGPPAGRRAGGSQGGGKSKGRIMLLWTATAILLSVAAIAGNLLLSGVGEGTLAVIRCFAAGAVVASLATEVFPKAFKEDHYMAGIATALGVILAFVLGSLGGG